MEMRLPAGFKAEDGTIQREFDVREMTGFDEEFLINNIKEGQEAKLDVLLGFAARMLTKLGTIEKITEADIKKLLVGDLTYILFAVRVKSMGEELPFDISCPKCNMINNETVNLTALKVKRLEDTDEREFDVVLDEGYTDENKVAHKKVRLRLLTVDDQLEVLKYTKTDPARSINTCFTKAIIKFGDLAAVTPTILKGLLKRDRDKMMNKITEKTPGVELTSDVICYNCGNKFNVSIGIENFFVSKAK